MGVRPFSMFFVLPGVPGRKFFRKNRSGFINFKKELEIIPRFL
jgi:hypothetical protein